MLTRAEGRKQAAGIAKERARDLKRKAREHLAELRAAIRHAKAHRKQAIQNAAANCRALRLAARARARDERTLALALLKEAAKAEREAAAHTCREGKAAAATKTGEGKAREALAVERRFRNQIRIAQRNYAKGTRDHLRTSARERRAQSDDEVRQNIPPQYLRLFEKVKRSIKGNERQSRTEAFLHYAEEHPTETYAAIDDDVDRRIAELEKRARQSEKALKKTRGKKASDVPF